MHPAAIYRSLPPLVLASASPRRAQLLTEMGLAFEICRSTVDEQEIFRHDPPSSLEERVLRVANAKREDVCLNLADLRPDFHDIMVLAADTAVFLDHTRLDKPQNLNEARHALARLAGHTHTVISALSLSYNDVVLTATDTAHVSFAPDLAAEIEYYLATQPPLDKAGAYGIQDWLGLVGIQRLEGSYTTVMGLPTHRLHRLLLQILLMHLAR